MPRMRILSPSEQEAFDKPPLFDHRERKKFFEFPKALLEAAQSMHSPDHRAGVSETLCMALSPCS